MDRDQVRRKLENERARLQQVRAAAGRLSAHSDAPGEATDVGPNPSEQATFAIEREMDQNVLQRTEAQLSELEDALRRLDDGSYGNCLACGRPIAEPRLEAMPAARYCVEDQARMERDPRRRAS